MNKITDDIVFTGDVDMSAATGTVPPGSVNENSFTSATAFPRSKFAQDAMVAFPIRLTDFVVHDAPQTKLPGTSANDDLGLYGTTFGTDTPSLKSSDLKTAGPTTLYARVLIPLPDSYEDEETVSLRLSAGMLTTVADTAATVDVEVYKSDREGGVDGSDLCTTAAQSINSLTLADKDFSINPDSLTHEDMLDVRITMAINDAATGTTVQGIIGAVELRCDRKG